VTTDKHSKLETVVSSFICFLYGNEQDASRNPKSEAKLFSENTVTERVKLILQTSTDKGGRRRSLRRLLVACQQSRNESHRTFKVMHMHLNMGTLYWKRLK